MDKLWAPWRTPYITGIDKKKKGCVFCAIIKERADAKNLIVIREKQAFMVLNLYPYNNGHCLVMPNRHVNDISKLTRHEREGLFDLLETTKSILQEVMEPHGFNIGMNIGRIAGAGVPGHVHMHIVPRWKGDVNFMPIVGGTKVISQSLKALHKALKDAYTQRI